MRDVREPWGAFGASVGRVFARLQAEGSEGDEGAAKYSSSRSAPQDLILAGDGTRSLQNSKDWKGFSLQGLAKPLIPMNTKASALFFCTDSSEVSPALTLLIRNASAHQFRHTFATVCNTHASLCSVSVCMS